LAHIKYFPVPYFGFGVGGGYANLTSSDGAEQAKLQWDNTSVIPVDAELTFRMYPFHKISPFATVGGSGVYWESSRYDTTSIRSGWDAFIKVGGGLEINLTSKLKLSLGADFRYCPNVDVLEHRDSGDENDGFITGNIGLTFHFPKGSILDLDNDGVPNDIDLDVRLAEDNDGFKDHDGIPEEDPDYKNFKEKLQIITDDENLFSQPAQKDTQPPIIIHKPIRVAEQGQRLNINAYAFEDDSLQVCAVVYRMRSELDWSVAEMTRKATSNYRYQATIPGSYLTVDGLEYFVAAVDRSISGIGYSGLPNRPLQVKVFNNPKKWRKWGGIVAAISWSAANFLLFRRQK
jgi:hypothetical protein